MARGIGKTGRRSAGAPHRQCRRDRPGPGPARPRLWPSLRAAALHAYGDEDDFCDFPETDELEPARQACSDLNEFPERVTSFWANQARLDLLKLEHPDVYAPLARIGATSGSSFERISGSR